MNPGSDSADTSQLIRLRKLERVLAWTMSALAVVMTTCYFTLVGMHWPPLDRAVLGTPFSLGTALGLGCLFIFIAMTVIFTIVSNQIERAQKARAQHS